MIVKLQSQAKDYAWGSTTLISDYFGLPATGRPMAEIWFGTHPAAPTRLADNPSVSLREHIGQDLGFLLKILAADSPLSLQVHPNLGQAVAGFAREAAAGIPLDSPVRNYKDANHKPEMIVALTEFEALCGFRSPAQIRNLLLDMAETTEASANLVRVARLWLNELASAGLPGLVRSVLDTAGSLGTTEPLGFNNELAAMAEFSARFELAARLVRLYPSDPGVMLALLMQHHHLTPGEALYLAPGTVHAYLGGLGVEVMAASDNVLRAGLTPKHIDRAELLATAEFGSQPIRPVAVRELANGLNEYPTPIGDFRLYRASVSGANLLAELELPAAAVLLCVGGEIELSDSRGEHVRLRKAEAAFVSPAARHLTIGGAGDCFIALG